MSKTIDSMLEIIKFVFRPDAIKLESKVIISFLLIIPFLGHQRSPLAEAHAMTKSLNLPYLWAPTIEHPAFGII